MAEERNVIAKYDYKATDDGELSIKKGEKLVLINDTGNWWLVQNVVFGSGLVPSNYLEKCKPSFLASLKNTLTRRRKNPKTDCGTGPAENGQVGECRTAGNETVLCSGGGVSVVATFAYDAQQSDELTLFRGDVVTVHEKSSDGWWKGRKEATGEIGWFPSNYVATPDDAQRTNSAGRLMSSSDGNHVTASHVGADPAASSSCRKDGNIRHVMTLYKFLGNGDRELSFDENEHLVILESAGGSAGADDEQWWLARNDAGKVGLVPRAFVKMVLASSPSAQTTAATVSQSDSGLGGRSPTSSSTKSLRCSADAALATRAASLHLTNKDWYVPNITRAECEQMMNQYAENGDFIIRESETNVGCRRFLLILFFNILHINARLFSLNL